MRVRVVLLLFLGLTAACSESPAPVAPEAMAALLADAHLAEVRSTQVLPSPGRAAGERNLDTLTAWYAAVLARHGVTQQEFLTAMNWYQNHPSTLDSVYKRSLALLEAAQADTTRR